MKEDKQNNKTNNKFMYERHTWCAKIVHGNMYSGMSFGTMALHI